MCGNVVIRLIIGAILNENYLYDIIPFIVPLKRVVQFFGWPGRPRRG